MNADKSNPGSPLPGPSNVSSNISSIAPVTTCTVTCVRPLSPLMLASDTVANPGLKTEPATATVAPTVTALPGETPSLADEEDDKPKVQSPVKTSVQLSPVATVVKKSDKPKKDSSGNCKKTKKTADKKNVSVTDSVSVVVTKVTQASAETIGAPLDTSPVASKEKVERKLFSPAAEVRKMLNLYVICVLFNST